MKLFENPKALMEFMAKNEVSSMQDLMNVIKEQILAPAANELLKTELTEHLSYEKYETGKKSGSNSRNGARGKTVNSNFGELEIQVPRDRDNEYEPQLIKNHQSDITGLDEKIISMYAKGMSARDIQAHIQEIYSVEISPAFVSNATNKILPLAKEWQSCPLKDIYTAVFMDAIMYSIRQNNQVIKKAAYVIIGIDLDGWKDILGLWLGENESAKFWLSVLGELKARGVKDILIASVDNLSGISTAIKAAFPNTDIQKCIVHQVRNSTKHVSYKDLKEFTADMKPIYNASAESEGYSRLADFAEKWGKKYAYAVKSWSDNWEELSTLKE